MKFSDLGKRVAVAFMLGPAVLAASWFGGPWFFALMLIIAGAAGYEFLKMLHKHMPAAQLWLNLIMVPAVFWPVYSNEFRLLIPVLTAWIFLAHGLELARKERSPIKTMGENALYVIYIVILYAFMIALRQLPDYLGLPYRWGGEWVILVLLSIWLCDTFAYFVGTRFGKHKLAPSLSPNKSVEGAIGGVLGAVATALACQIVFASSLSSLQAGVVGLIIGVFGQFSDLIESMYKRAAAVKDSSDLLPGHGGMLDRFDSPLFSVPVVVLYLYSVMALK